MASLAIAAPAQAVRRTSTATLITYLKETKYEFLKLARTKTFSLSIIGFPVMFYLLFGVGNRTIHDGAVHVAKYELAGYACFGMIGAALFGIGVGLGAERANGWLELKRASPMPPLAYLIAKCNAAIGFAFIIVTVLIGLAITLGGVQLSGVEAVKMLGVAVLGTIPFAAMGILVALVVPANASSGIINLIYLPMSFASGLWIPLHMLPKWLQVIAPIQPAYHLSQLMLSVFGYQNASSLRGHWTGLTGFALVMLGISWAVFHRAEQDA